MANASLEATPAIPGPSILASGGVAARSRLAALQGQTVVIKYGGSAAALGAVKVIFLSDVPGIRDREGHLLHRVTRLDIDALIQHGVIEGGMLPKVEACRRALKGGVGSAHIVDGRLPNALLLKLFTHTGLGTEVVL